MTMPRKLKWTSVSGKDREVTLDLEDYATPDDALDAAQALRFAADECERVAIKLREAEAAPTSDRLLNIKDAAAKLGRSADWLYRRAKRLPFTVRDGRLLQFSEQGIEHWIRARARMAGQRGGRE